jgi:molybdopterin synthase sulfur carrier subunit
MIRPGSRLHAAGKAPAVRAAGITSQEHMTMAIEVRIPTILRSYTGGEKSVEGSGATLAELFADLDARYDGLQGRLVDDSGLRRFLNVYLNDEDVRFLGGLEAPVSDGDTVTVLPAVAGGSRPAGVPEVRPRASSARGTSG